MNETAGTNKNLQFEERLGYKTEDVMKLYRHFLQARKKHEPTWKFLDACDRGFLWDIVNNSLPKYAIKPDTNWINYVKSCIVNSIYTGTYRGDVYPRSYKYKDYTRALNAFIEFIWDKLRIGHYLLRAGERAALLNFGALEFGWDADIIDGADELFHGDLQIKFIDNLSLLLDPAALDPYDGRGMFIMNEVSLVELRNEKRFRERIDEYTRIKDTDSEIAVPNLVDSVYGKGDFGQRSRQSQDETVRLLTCYYKYQPKDAEGYRIDQLWLIDDGYILDVKTDIKPKTFPVRILYASPPVADPYGVPVTKLILYNVITLNVLDSIESTHIYSSVRRPKVLSRRANVNEANFAKEGNNPDKLWLVDGIPDQVLKYIDLPELPRDRHLLKQNLIESIMRVTGVDDRYTGRDTGSVQTTGGMDILNQRLSMSDNTRVSMLHEFVIGVTKLILSFYLEYGGNRQFPLYKKSHVIDELLNIDFNELKQANVKFDFVVNITPHLPNNVLRRAEAANVIMEKQMQYQFNPPLITPEEWLETQDFPQKNHMIERMAADRMRDDALEVESDIVNYAGMVGQGMSSEGAINELALERQLKRERPGLGNTGGSGSFQERQK